MGYGGCQGCGVFPKTLEELVNICLIISVMGREQFSRSFEGVITPKVAERVLTVQDFVFFPSSNERLIADLLPVAEFITSHTNGGIRLLRDHEAYARYMAENTKEAILEDIRRKIGGRDLAFVHNPFGYTAAMAVLSRNSGSDVEHWCLWRVGGELTREELFEAIGTKFPEAECGLYFEQPPAFKSVADIDHGHFIFRKAIR